MPKKVFALAKELEIGAVDLVEKLRGLGLDVRNHMVALSDEEVAMAMQALGAGTAADDADKKSKKSTVKKKVTAKKKVTKKKVIKKKAETAQSNEEVIAQDSASEAAEVATTAPEEKLAPSTTEDLSDDSIDGVRKFTVVRKAKEVKEKKAAQKEAAAEKKAQEERQELYKEKLHSFTPVFIPEELPKKADGAAQTKMKKYRDEDDVSVDIVDLDGDDEKNKKRFGQLASIVTKKSVKSKDINLLRAEEELKTYSAGVVGQAIYRPAKKKKVYSGATKQTEITEIKDSKRIIGIKGSVTANDLAQKLAIKFQEFANQCLDLNLLVKKDDVLGIKLAAKIAELWRFKVQDISFDEQAVIEEVKAKIDKASLPLRNPIITVMGHVDHGKTTLLDFIRKATVADGEAGGITQHIGAYNVEVNNSTLTFLDTPGHAAFASMRQRGANVTDIVVLVVAADDGVMPQTRESVRFIQAANVPMIVAVNKMDREGANPDRVKQELMEFGITPEEWGGDTQFVEISALKGTNIDKLLESIQVLSEILDLRESPQGAAEGVVIESKLESGRGAVSTILVQKGTLHKGDTLVVGETFGRARSLMDSSGKLLNSAGPSMPVQVLGLNDVANPGDVINVVKNEREAKRIVDNRVNERKEFESASKKKMTLEDFFANTSESVEKKVLNLIVRTDVHGSYEAIKNSLESLGNDEVAVHILGGGVGAITDNDVLMAADAQAIIIGFNMRPMTSARRIAEQKGVDIKTYAIIYELINDIQLALEGMLDPDFIEKFIGRAQVKDTFNIPKIGTIAGSSVVDGKIQRGCNIRLLRDGKIVFDGKLSSLKRFKDDVKEVGNGYECGIALEGFNDVKVDDIFEAYILEEKKRKLESSMEATL